MQSSSLELVDEPVADVDLAEPAPAPAPLIMLASDDSGVCAVDGWCD